MGLDSLVNLPTWHEPQKLIELCYLAVLNRPGYQANMDELEREIPGIKARVVFISASELEIASSDLQARVRAGRSIEYLVPDGVASYIEELHLNQT